LSGFTIVLAAFAISIGIHLALIELAFNPDAKWDEIKGDVILSIMSIFGVWGTASKIGTVIGFAVGFILGYEANS